jgi:Protein of unknown function (DUF2726)
MQTLPWIVALAALGLLVLVLAGTAWTLQRRAGKKAAPLPSTWALTARPVFSADERRIYRLLREALPHHVVLAKLPLVRFCQPNEPESVRYWFDLLGSTHVTFAVCSANGRVLAAIDLDNDRSNSRRILQIKQSVLAACRVRYLRCPVDQLPSVAELQLLVPHVNASMRGPQPAGAGAQPLREARDTLSSTVANRRAQRSALWQDSTLFQDSFFAPDTRGDGFVSSDFAALRGNSQFGAMPRSGADTARQPDDDTIAAVVVDTPPHWASSTRH